MQAISPKDALDFGIEPDSQSKEITEVHNLDDNFFREIKIKDARQDNRASNSNKVALPDNMLENPFFVSLKGGSLSFKTNKEIFSKFKRCLVICLKNSVVNPTELNNLLINRLMCKEDYNKISELCTILEAPIKLIKNMNHRRQATIVERHRLSPFNHGRIELENDEVVVPLFELCEKSGTTTSSFSNSILP